VVIKATIFLSGFLFLFSCVDVHKDPVEYESLILLQVLDLDIEGPSGLSKSYLPGHFYTVCDNTGNVYLINNMGEIFQTIELGGDDLEGVEFVEENLSIYVVEERFRTVIRLTPGGSVLDTFHLDIPVQNLNDGPEGIAYNPEKKHFYIVNEKNPALLFVFDTLFQKINEFPLSFAKDYSSVDYEPVNDRLWILSEESQILANCNLEGVPEKIYKTDMPDGEGLVIDVENELIYIVCDDTSRLFVFRLPETD
jgi:uncharacterized protein YjiK